MKNILALNGDGFGCRLAAMLNAIKISQAFGENFYFRWNWGKDVMYHTLEPKECVFSQDFIKKYHIDNFSKDLIDSYGSYKNFFENYEEFNNFRAYVNNGEFVKYCKKYNLENQWNSFSYKQAFNFIGFSQKYKNIINKICSLNLKSTTAIHLRGGDVIHTDTNKRLHLVVKITPLPIAIELISKFQSEDIVFVVQDAEMEDFLMQNYNVKVVSSFYEDYYDKYEKAFFDMMFMSQCQKIIASHSGFSISASYIGESDIISYRDVFNSEDLCKIIKSYYLNLTPYKIKIPNQYISYDAFSLLNYGKKHLTKDEYIYWCEYGFKYNEENSTFLILQVFCHYAFEEYDLADDIIKKQFSNSNSFKRLILSIQTNYYAKFQLSRDTYFDAFVANCKEQTYGFFLYSIFMIEFYMKDNRTLDEFFVGEDLSKIDFEILVTDLCLEARVYLKYFFNFFAVTQILSHQTAIDEKSKEINSKSIQIQHLNATFSEAIKQKDQIIQTKTQELETKTQELTQTKNQLDTTQKELDSKTKELSSLPIKKQTLEIKNLEQDLINKQLHTKQLEKELGYKSNVLKELELKNQELIQTKNQLDSTKKQLESANKILSSNPNPSHLIQNTSNFKGKLSYLNTLTTAKSRIHNHLSYKLGQAMIENSKSLLGYIRMPYVLSYIKEKHKQEQQQYQETIKKNPNLKLPNLESYPDYKESLKEKECFTYKLGEALMKVDKTWYKGGYVKLWFEVRELKKEFEK